jgi:carbonic anhydrase
MRAPVGSRKLVTPLVAVLALILVMGFWRQLQATVGGDDGVARLTEGNARFVSGKPAHPNTGADRRSETLKGQKPFAAVVSCSDSRVPVELVFDQGIGDIFVIRVAGNVCGPAEIGSVEYGVEHLGTPLVAVLGHTKCGAVTAAVNNSELPGSLPSIVGLIRPAADSARAAHPDLDGDSLVTEAVRANVWQSMQDLLTKSAIVREAVNAGHIRLVGAVYDLGSGQVEWLGQHPDQARLLAAGKSEEED